MTATAIRRLAFCALLGGPAALAEEAFWEVLPSADLIAVAYAGKANAAADGIAQPVAVEAAVGLTATRIAFSGLETGVRLEGRLASDAPDRSGFFTVAGACPPGIGDCPDAGGLSPVGAAGGAAAAGAYDGPNGRAVLERAYGFVRGGWGEVSLGRDAGAGLRFTEPLPGPAPALSLETARLDPGGLGQVRTISDPTGPAAKITYASPRWLGLRLGLSFAPQADAVGADLAPGARDLSGVAYPDLETIAEAAVSFTRRLSGRGRLGASAAFAVSDTGASALGFEGLSQAGLAVRYDGALWAFGASGLASNNARSGEAGYRALALGVARRLGDWTAGAQWGVSDDDLSKVQSTTVQIGASREVADGFTLQAGWSAQARLIAEQAPGGRVARTQRTSGPFIGIELKR